MISVLTVISVAGLCVPVEGNCSFDHASGGKIGFAEAADLDGAGESVLQRLGYSLLRVRPLLANTITTMAR